MYLFALLQHFTTLLHTNEKKQNKKGQEFKSSGLSLTFQVAGYIRLVGGEFSS